MNPIFEGVEALTFDCYGTIVDWEAGILAAAREVLVPGNLRSAGGPPGDDTHLSDDDLLEMFGRFESEAERPPFRRYREVLAEVATRIGEAVGRPVTSEAASRFAESVPDWPPFPDSREALARLSARYRLAIVSNVDDDLFAGTAERLGVDFTEVVTAEQVGGYKPRPDHFEEVVRRLDLPRRRIVHVAQSLYHDVAPAKALGFTCVWVDRRMGRGGPGATPPGEASPDLVVSDLATLANAAGA